MQHTLIPSKDRQRLHREYYIRVGIVATAAVAVAVAVGAAALFPAYIRASFDDFAAQSAVAVTKKEADPSLAQTKAALAADSKLVAVLAGQSGSRLSQTVISLVAVRGAVTLSSIEAKRSGPDGLALTLSGTAPTRDDLLAFRDRLEQAMPGADIVIPIDQLARSSAVPFQISFAYKMR